MATTDTKLEMVNTVLEELGESAVNSLDDSRAVRTVLRAMDREKKRVLINKGQGYTFNRYKYTPQENINGQYPVPENTLRIETTGNANLQVRNGLLYDVSTNSYTDIYYDSILIILDLDYEDLSFLAEEYIVNATIYRLKKKLAFSTNEINEAFGIRQQSEDALNEQEIYQLQSESANNRFRNFNVYTDQTSNNNLKRI